MSKMTTRWDWLLGIVIGGGYILSANCVHAQITPDATLRNNSIVTPSGNTINITGGTQAGNNLFHSFQQFSVPTGGGAFFNNTVDIQNIISRVTGGSVSNIDGLIHTLGTANLFLINPNGIIFGRNASLNIGGSFLASTASSLKFADGFEFSAIAPQTTPLLTVSVPIGLQYGGNPGRIFNQSQATDGATNSFTPPVGLQVQPGRTLALVGGDVSLDGRALTAPGGRVELGGLAEVGTVGLNLSGNNLSLSFPDAVARGDVSISNGASVSVASGGGSSIAVNARNIDILGSTLRAGISPLAETDGAQAGDVNLNATGTLRIKNSSVYNAAFGRGNAGNLRVDTGKLIIQDGVLATATISGGRAGDLIVNASDSVELTGSPTSNGTVPIIIPVKTFFGSINFPVDFPIGVFSASIDARSLPNVSPSLNAFLPIGGGDAGNLTVNTGHLTVSNGAVVSAGTISTGRAGNLTVNARDFIELSDTSPNDTPPGLFNLGNRVPSGLRNETAGRGVGGNLTIETRRLIVRDGALVTTGTGGKMPGGELTINASESVDLSGTSVANKIPSALISGTRGAGNARPLSINTQRLSVRDGAVISAGTTGDGQGGNLTINASDSVELIGTSREGLSAELLNELLGVTGTRLFGIIENSPLASGIITGSVGNGNAGNLSINTGRLLIKDGAQASVSTVGLGNAGSLNVHASSVNLTGTSQQSLNRSDIAGRSLLTTAVGENSTGNGGNITVQTDLLTISDGAGLTASTSGQGNAGSIKVSQAKLVSVSDNGLISTAVNAQAKGEGGSIDINTNTLSVNQGGQITASTLGKGNAGRVMIDARDAVSLDGVGTNGFSSGVFTSTGSQANGSGGAITFQTGSFSLSNGAVVNAQTSSSQRGGNVTINANTFAANNGGQVITTTRSSGNAGDINLKVAEGITISGSDRNAAERIAQFGDTIVTNQGDKSGLFANTSSNSMAQGGNLTINTPSLRVQDGGTISVSSPQGQAGNLDITAKTILLNQGSLTAETNAGEGANIKLQNLNLLLLQNQSLISAQAFNNAKGGNINIDAPNGFIVAVPEQNNDIIANAFQGQGGKINITSQGNFGIAERRSTPPNTTNDIDASSDFGFTGKVTINTPDVDPSKGLTQLPTVLANTSKVIADTSCGAIASTDSDTDKSKFTITGRGGLPPSPNEPLTTDVLWLDTRFAAITTQPQRSEVPAAKPPSKLDAVKIVPATGWVFDGKGNVTLISNASNANGLASTPAKCGK